MDSILINIDGNLKSRFDRTAKMEGKTRSEKIRELMSEYVSERDIGKWIDDIWNGIGNTLKSAGYKQKDVEQAVKRARKRGGLA